MSHWSWLLDPASLVGHNGGRILAALHLAANGLIGLALLGVAFVLAAFFVRRRRPHYAWLLTPLVVACALTYFAAMMAQAFTVYGLDVLIDIATAIIAIITAVTMGVLAPRVLAVPTAAHLTGLNTELAAKAEASRAELVASNARLTLAVAEKTQVQWVLARSEEQYRVSFEGATVGKVQSDPATGVVLRANPAFAAMLGYAPEEIIGRVGWELTWPEDRAADQTEFARVTSGEIAAYVREKRFLRKDGTAVWARVSANIVSFPDSGEPNITIAVVEDIDQRRKTQAALDGVRADLEAVVMERTAALAQRDLLLREVYHRVKNNLQVVDSMLVLQARRLADPAAKSALSSLRARVYALGLVHHQLMGSANLQTFDVAPFLQELSRNLVDGAAVRGVDIVVDAAPLNVGLDFAIPLGLLVTELVTNSLKHAFPEGKGRVRVVLSQTDDGGVALVVSDDGTGYNFDEPAPTGTNSRLGATIIRGLVHQLKGTMSVQSLNGTRSEVRMAAAA